MALHFLTKLLSRRPDPFRFRPTRERRHLYWFFKPENRFLLKHRNKVEHVRISDEHLAKLKGIQGKRTLLMLNHVNFADPQVLFELSIQAQFYAKWLAGVETFDFMYGLMGWHMESVGGFSIDRGVLDRRALQYAQKTMDEGAYPLVVYPEGEAPYTNKVLQSFFPGAALFALRTAESLLEDNNQDVHIIPISVYYRFIGNAEATLQAACENVHQNIPTKFAHTPKPLIKNQSLWQMVETLIEDAMGALEAEQPQYPKQSYASLSERLHAFKNYLLNGIHQEHMNAPAPSELSKDELMVLKNRLRSAIARKCYAPPRAELQDALSQTQALQKEFDAQQKLSSAFLKKLATLEIKWIGVSETDKSIDKRISSLEQHLSQQQPFAEILEKASPADIARWEAQMNETRRVKLLQLLTEDLERKDSSPEGIDETLVKLEILLFSTFKYRGPKEVLCYVADPIDVKAYIRAHPEVQPKKLQTQLIEAVQKTIGENLEKLIQSPSHCTDSLQSQHHVSETSQALECRGQ